MSIRKKALLDEVFYDVLSIDPRPEIKQKLLNIYRMDNINYKYLLAFLYRVEANVIASIILIAEEIAMADGDMTEDEIIRLNILRQYLTERTGKDYSKNYYRINKTDM